MKKHLIAILIIFIVTLTSCQLYPQPEDTISKPKPSDGKSVSSKDISSIVANFLPEGATLDDLKGSIKPIQTADMDGDGSEEIIALYKIPGGLPKMGVLVLKKDTNEWKNIFVEDDLINNIGIVTKISLSDVTGDNNPELFIEYDNRISICTYINEKIYSTYNSMFTDYRIEDLPGMYGKDNMKEVIVRNSNSTDLDIKVLRWSGISFDYVIYEYPALRKEMKDFYSQLFKSNPKNARALISIADLEIKENNYSKALELIKKATVLNTDKSIAHIFPDKEASCLMGLGKYDEAMKIYKSTPNGYSIADCYIAQKKYDKAREVVKSISIYPYDEKLQDIDIAEAKDKIFNFINTSKENNTDAMLSALVEWGKKENIVITYSNPTEPNESKFDVFLIDYSIHPSKSFGKEGVGDHFICWLDNSKPLNTSIHQMQNMSVRMYGLYKAAASNVTVEDGGRLKLKVTYEFYGSSNQYKLPAEMKKTFKLHDNFWKKYWN